MNRIYVFLLALLFACTLSGHALSADSTALANAVVTAQDRSPEDRASTQVVNQSSYSSSWVYNPVGASQIWVRAAATPRATQPRSRQQRRHLRTEFPGGAAEVC